MAKFLKLDRLSYLNLVGNMMKMVSEPAKSSYTRIWSRSYSLTEIKNNNINFEG